MPDRPLRTSPAWYGLVLRTEACMLRHLYPRLRRAGEAKDAMSATDASHALPNLLGNSIPERAVLNEVPGWVAGQHVARYAWAMAACARHTAVDLGTGDGYGAFLLSRVATSVIGIDVDERAITAARERYPGVAYAVADLLREVDLPEAEVGVAFEVLEHLDDPLTFLAHAFARYDRVLISVPNPIFHGSRLNPHHRLDQPLGALKRCVRQLDGQIVQVRHQTRRDPGVSPGAFPWSSIWMLDVDCRRSRLD